MQKNLKFEQLFDLFLEVMAEILKKIVVAFGDMKTSKGHFKIN